MELNAQHLIDAQQQQIAELSQKLAIANATIRQLTQDVQEDEATESTNSEEGSSETNTDGRAGRSS